MSRQSVFLVGPPGAGKTTIGKQLAKLLGLTFADSDTEIEQRCGVDIAFIFEKEGEDGFRDREVKVVDELSQQPGVLLATGGGAVMREENRQALRARGTVIYLLASVEQQLSRTRHSNRRPLLNTGNKEAALTQLFATRDPLYREIADVIIETRGRPARLVAKEAMHLLEQAENPLAPDSE